MCEIGAVEEVDYQRIEAIIGYAFGDRAQLREALTHPSFANESTHHEPHYERLEFLGDAVIELGVSQLLFHRFPNVREGRLTQLRASLVNATHLAAVAEAVGISPLIRLGRGEVGHGGRDGRGMRSILADVVEALVGAVFLDGGFAAAMKTVDALLGDGAAALVDGATVKDAKSQLQELAQERLKTTPVYVTIGATGPQHAVHFEAEVQIGAILTRRGVGRSKKDAQQDAATQALQALQNAAETEVAVQD
ncbi:MAG: ribonuclease-3 [Myxococcota bacterium]|jgi:ribonuclease-3